MPEGQCSTTKFWSKFTCFLVWLSYTKRVCDCIILTNSKHTAKYCITHLSYLHKLSLWVYKVYVSISIIGVSLPLFFNKLLVKITKKGVDIAGAFTKLLPMGVVFYHKPFISRTLDILSKMKLHHTKLYKEKKQSDVWKHEQVQR